MARKTYPTSLDPDVTTDYALIATGVACALFAFIYLIMV